MTTYRTSRRSCQGIVLVAIIGLLSACGGSDDASSTTGSAVETAAPVSADEPSETETEAEAETETAPPPAADGDVNTTLSLANGEVLEFSVICVLEPQIAAGSEILFTATSFGDPAIDITQFGDAGPVTDIASVSVYDASFETLWDARSDFEPLGGFVELSLDGSTINGSGSFFPGGDVAATPVDGIVVANC